MNAPFFGGSGSTPFFQAKLTVNQPGDRYEQEADQVADQVMRMRTGDASIAQRTPVQFVQRACACEHEQKNLQRKETGRSDAGGHSAPPIVSDVLSSGGGQPLDASTQQFMSSRMDQDFSQVRVHTDSRAAESASAIQARAYTSGQHVVFGAGEYQPSSESGKRLLAHELVHVGQQKFYPNSKLQRVAISPREWSDRVRKARKDQDESEYLEIFKSSLPNHKVEGLDDKINLAKGGEKDNSKLKPGYNFDLTFMTYGGATGYLENGKLTTFLTVTLDEALPPSAILIGPSNFIENIPTSAKETIAHELAHFEHQRITVKLVEDWRKSFSDSSKKSTEERERLKKYKNDPVKLRNKFTLWLQNNYMHPSKKLIISDFEFVVTVEQVKNNGLMTTEILASLEGFKETRPDWKIANEKNDQQALDYIFSTLTNYPVERKFWSNLLGENVKEVFLNRLLNFYCDTLDDVEREIFDAQIKRRKDQFDYQIISGARKIKDHGDEKDGFYDRVMTVPIFGTCAVMDGNNFYCDITGRIVGKCQEKKSKKKSSK
ncbi:MAG: DUF4157 domain-containing protein [Saprospiraceae bacterium]